MIKLKAKIKVCLSDGRLAFYAFNDKRFFPGRRGLYNQGRQEGKINSNIIFTTTGSGLKIDSVRVKYQQLKKVSNETGYSKCALYDMASRNDCWNCWYEYQNYNTTKDHIECTLQKGGTFASLFFESPEVETTTVNPGGTGTRSQYSVVMVAILIFNLMFVGCDLNTPS